MSTLGSQLAGRLNLPADDPRLEPWIAAAEALATPKVDPARVAMYPELWSEVLLQLAVKISETGMRGLGYAYDGSGIYGNELAGQATAGLLRSVSGILNPLTRTGGIGIG